MRRAMWIAGALALLGCGPADGGGDDADVDLAARSSAMSAAARRSRAATIRDAAAARGLRNGLLLAGIAEAETHMAHCWNELTWACQGPSSPDCGGGPMVAGASDGPCSAKEGGLGMFQFDAGTHHDTLAREGDRIRTVAGSVDAAIDFVVDMVVRSAHIGGVSTEAQAIAWMNGVTLGGASYDRWLTTVVHHYNGCDPSYCGVFWGRYDHYDASTRALVDEMGAAFWAATPRMGLTWKRLDDGSYSFAAWGQPKAARVRYAIDGEVVGHAAKDDPGTPAHEDVYPLRTPVLAAGADRLVEIAGFDAGDRLVGRAIGQIEVTPQTAVYVREIGARDYEIGLERAPAQVAAIEVRVDGYLLTDTVSGRARSDRLAVRHVYERLGPRGIAVTTFGADGEARGTLHRSFTLE